MIAALVTRMPGPGSTINWPAVAVLFAVVLVLIAGWVVLAYMRWQPRTAAAYDLAKRLDRAEEVLVYVGVACAALAGVCGLLGYETPGVALGALALMIVFGAAAAAVAESLTMRKVRRVTRGGSLSRRD